jgi:hypothetical protein
MKKEDFLQAIRRDWELFEEVLAEMDDAELLQPGSSGAWPGNTFEHYQDHLPPAS